jgi:glycosyltransferase involved in cell wall biosynthesis
MKVLQIINSLEAGGAEKLVVDMAIAYHKKGMEVTVLILNGKSTPLYKQLESNSEVQLHYIAMCQNIYHPINILKIKPWLSKFDVVHVHLFPSSYWVAIANLISFKKNNIIFTEHNSTNRRRSKPLFKYIDKIIYKQFKRIVTISEAVDSGLKSHLGKRFKNIVKIHNGIHLDTIENAFPYTKEALGCKQEQQLILQVASFTPQKDQITLIKAISQLPQEYVLLLVGDGPLIHNCKTLVKQLNLEQRVQFLGVRNDVPSLLKSVDVVVLASHFEGLSLSCIEGMASGKPFVASNTPGLGDIVKDAGLLFEDNDDHKLSTIISSLTTDKTYYKQTTLKCQERAKQFDINDMIMKYSILYNRIITTLI